MAISASFPAMPDYDIAARWIMLPSNSVRNNSIVLAQGEIEDQGTTFIDQIVLTSTLHSTPDIEVGSKTYSTVGYDLELSYVRTFNGEIVSGALLTRTIAFWSRELHGSVYTETLSADDQGALVREESTLVRVEKN
jgi:hypothetical protein